MSSIRSTPKEIRDGHSSYQWVYFAEEIKQRISYFLSDKLFGKNLDIGGGRYLTHPRSTVVDISPKALEYNPAKEKVEFDIDMINQGVQLPFPDKSFDHATMISVYQYIKGGDVFMKELQRVLKPGAELYIINHNGGGSGLSADGILQNPTTIGAIEDQFKKNGYTTLVENIPFRSDITDTQSLCVALPGVDLFGPHNGEIRNRQQREMLNEANSRYRGYLSSLYNRHMRDEIEDDNDETRHVDYFTKLYTKREITKMNDLFYKIATYPVTPFSVEYKKAIEAFTQECLNTTECVPIVFSHRSIDIYMDMADDLSGTSFGIHVMGKNKKASSEEEQQVMQIARKHQLKVNSYYASLGGNTPDEFIAYYEKKGKEDQYQPLWNTYQKRRFSDDEQSKIISFLSEVALNSSMKELQDRLYALTKSRASEEELELIEKDKQRMKQWEIEMQQRRADLQQWNAQTHDEDEESEKPERPSKPEPLTRPRYCKVDELMMKMKARGYFNMLSATKQRRQVDALLKIKEQYISEEKIAAEWKSIDYLSFMPYFADFFASDDESAYRGSKMSGGD